MKTSLYDHCMAEGLQGLLTQWHPVRNGDLTPETVSVGSEQKVWWRCELGHEWQAPVYARTGPGRRDGCPVCAGKIVLAGFNDLASRFPDVARQWHPERNGVLRPDGVTAYSNRRVYWLCPKGHTYRAAVAARTRQDCGCPYCAGRRVLAGFNDLATLHPDTAKQWHPRFNGTLTPCQVGAGSHKRVWWQCGAGHVWQAVVYSRTGNQQAGCPVCAGRIKEPQFGVKQPETAV